MNKLITKSTTLAQIFKLSPPCRCSACENGCKFSSGFLANNEIKPLAKFLKVSEKELKTKYLDEVEKFNTKLFRPKAKKPFGKCIFFDQEKKCRIHKAKPMECKIATGCKDYGEQLSIWFTLNYFVNPDDPESVRQWNIYLKSGGKNIPGGKLEELVPDKKKLKQMLTYKILKKGDIICQKKKNK